jgi:hypothetical protein
MTRIPFTSILAIVVFVALALFFLAIGSASLWDWHSHRQAVKRAGRWRAHARAKDEANQDKQVSGPVSKDMSGADGV